MYKGIVVYKVDPLGKYNEVCRFEVSPNKFDDTRYKIVGTVNKKNGHTWSRVNFTNIHVTHKEFQMEVSKEDPAYSRVIPSCTKFDAERFILMIKNKVDRRCRFTYKLLA